MQALTYHGRRDLRLSDLPDPEPGPGELLLRVTDCILSQGIVDFNVEGHFFDPLTPHPVTGIGNGYVMGQQFGGTITSVGSGVKLSPGTTVGVAPGFGCGNCPACQAGRQNHCDQYSYYGLLGAHGGLAPYCVVREACVVPMPRSLGPLFEGLLVVHNLLMKSRPWLNTTEPVLVLGAGPIGLCAATLLRDLFQTESLLHDVLPNRGERARKAGYQTATERDLQRQYQLVLDCAGTNPETGGSAIIDGLERVAKGGALMSVGTYLSDTTISPLNLLFRELTLGASFAYTDADVELLVQRLDEVQLDLDEISERITLPTAARDGLLRGEVDRDSFTVLIVEP